MRLAFRLISCGPLHFYHSNITWIRSDRLPANSTVLSGYGFFALQSAASASAHVNITQNRKTYPCMIELPHDRAAVRKRFIEIHGWQPAKIGR